MVLVVVAAATMIVMMSVDDIGSLRLSFIWYRSLENEN
jgi:hypothetical protein